MYLHDEAGQRAARLAAENDQLRAELAETLRLLRAAEDELAGHRQRAAARTVETRPLTSGPELTVRLMTPPAPACPDCPRPRHGGYTCEEAADIAGALERAFRAAWEQGPHLGAAFIAPAPGP